MTRNSLVAALLLAAGPSSAVVPPVEHVCFDGDARRAPKTATGSRAALILSWPRPTPSRGAGLVRAPPGDAGAAKIAAALVDHAHRAALFKCGIGDAGAAALGRAEEAAGLRS